MNLLALKQLDQVALAAFIDARIAGQISIVSNIVPLSSGIESLYINFGTILSGMPAIGGAVSMPSGQPLIQFSPINPTTSGFVALFSNYIPGTGYNLGYIANP